MGLQIGLQLHSGSRPSPTYLLLLAHLPCFQNGELIGGVWNVVRRCSLTVPLLSISPWKWERRQRWLTWQPTATIVTQSWVTFPLRDCTFTSTSQSQTNSLSSPFPLSLQSPFLELPLPYPLNLFHLLYSSLTVVRYKRLRAIAERRAYPVPGSDWSPKLL